MRCARLADHRQAGALRRHVDEGTDEVPEAIAAYAAAEGAGAVAISARVEAELAELDAAEASAMRSELASARRGSCVSCAAPSRCWT